MTITLKARIPQKIDTTANWNESTLILMRGEIGFEETEDGQILQKTGDGINVWSALAYQGSSDGSSSGGGSSITINRWEEDD